MAMNNDDQQPLSSGRIIQLNHNEQVMLKQGEMYLLAEDENFINQVHNVRDDLIEHASPDTFSQPYHLNCISVDYLDCIEGLRDQMSNGANLIIPILAPNILEDTFIVAKVEHNTIDYKLPMLINIAETISLDAKIDAFINLAIQDPESSIELLKETFKQATIEEYEKDGLIKDGAYSDFDGDAELVFGAIPLQINEYKFEDGFNLYRKFLENCELLSEMLKKDSTDKAFLKKKNEIKDELRYVIKDSTFGGNIDLFIRMFINAPKETWKNNFDYFDRYSIAQESKVEIGIEEFDKIDSTKKADGLYRVFVRYNQKKSYMHFSRKPSCIIYMMYLMDRYKKDMNVKSIDISKNRDLFCKLYQSTYKVSGEKEFDNMVKKNLSDEKRSTNLRQYLIATRDAVQNTFINLKLEEKDQLPFIISSSTSHLTVRRKKITIAESLLNACNT